MSLFKELRRRNVFKVSAVYGVVSWLIIQIVALFVPALRLPDWTVTFFAVLMIIGFPFAILLSWAYELTPDGVKPTPIPASGQSKTNTIGQKLNYAVITSLIVAVGFLFVDYYILNENSEPIEVSGNGVLPNSVAVLPFDNLSPDANDAYFAAGLHEEILNQLAKLSELNVISRTTMRQYTNTEKSIIEVAGELNVKTVMEGSVRFAENRIRITTQLIDAKTNAQLWSQTYEREFEDVFSIETDIAMQVATALEAEFSLDERARIEKVPTASPEAYALYLSAQVLIRQGTPDDLTLGLERINRAVELDPDFAIGWAWKAGMYNQAGPYFPEQIAEFQVIAEESVLKALQLDPDIGFSHLVWAYLLSTQGEWEQVRGEYLRADDLGLTTAESFLPMYTFALGYIEEIHGLTRRFRELSPLDADYTFQAMITSDILGETQEAKNIYELGKVLYEIWPAGHFNMFAILLGRGEELEAVELARQYVNNGPVQALLEDFDDHDAALIKLHSLYEGENNIDLISRMGIATLSAYFGDAELAFSALEDSMNAFALNVLYVWTPLFSEVRQLASFKQYMRDKGFVDYWQKNGWPDLCQPVGSDDFICD